MSFAPSVLSLYIFSPFSYSAIIQCLKLQRFRLMLQVVQGLREILLLFFSLLCTFCSLYYLKTELFPHKNVGSCYKDDAILTFMEIGSDTLWRK